MRIVINQDFQSFPNIKTLIESLINTFDEGGITLYNKRNIIKSFTIALDKDNEKTFIIKKFKCPNIFQRIIYSFLRPSKACKAYRNSIILRNNGISTPLGIAYVELWDKGLFKTGYYICDEDNDSPIAEELNIPEKFNKSMASDLANFASILHSKGIFLGDFNSTNVLYHLKDDGHYSFSVIDINRMNYLKDRMPSKEYCFENLTRFTGRMDLYEYVLREYLIQRNWNIDKWLSIAIATKLSHDKRWKKRKSFIKKVKNLIN
jgi:hypothetical protein